MQVTNIDDDDTPPVAIPDTYSTLFMNTLEVPSPGVLHNDYDHADPLMAMLYGPYPEHGILTFYDSGSFTFIPNDTFTGEITFQYKAFDGLVYSSPVTVVIEIVASHQFLPMIKR